MKSASLYSLPLFRICIFTAKGGLSSAHSNALYKQLQRHLRCEVTLNYCRSLCTLCLDHHETSHATSLMTMMNTLIAFFLSLFTQRTTNNSAIKLTVNTGDNVSFDGLLYDLSSHHWPHSPSLLPSNHVCYALSL